MYNNNSFASWLTAFCPAGLGRPPRGEEKNGLLVKRQNGLQDVLDGLSKRETMLQKEYENLRSAVLEIGGRWRTNPVFKQKMNRLLSKKKACVARLERNSELMTTVEATKTAIEDANVNVHVVGAMKEAAQVMRRSAVDVQRVDDLMIELGELSDGADSVSRSLSSPESFVSGSVSSFDDSEIEAELDEMILEEDRAKATRVSEKPAHDEDVVMLGPDAPFPKVPRSLSDQDIAVLEGGEAGSGSLRRRDATTKKVEKKRVAIAVTAQ